MLSLRTPVAVLNISKTTKNVVAAEPSEAVYGGYSNARGDVFLFADDLVYKVNFKNQTLQQRPKLNSGAQSNYDATAAGEAFEYCRVAFRRLSDAQIKEICASGSFRITSKF